MKILIATDSFKDSLSAQDVCCAIEKGLKLASSDFEIKTFPLGDGGEGTVEVLSSHLNGVKQSLTSFDPLFRPIRTEYLIVENIQTAFIEIAKTSGLQLLSEKERNPMFTSTFGVGEMIKDAINKGIKKIVLTLGGSATTDAGIGMAISLGYNFFDNQNHILKGVGSDLLKIDTISIPPALRQRLSEIEFSALYDVNNPLFGKKGAAYVYASQKGAKKSEIRLLDDGLRNLVEKGSYINEAEKEGSGAAGGLGFGSIVFLGATLQNGTDQIIRLTSFEKKLQDADLIITGEGKIDNQTKHGKVISGVVALANKYNIPVIAVCGTLDADFDAIKSLGLKAAFSINSKPVKLHYALKNTKNNLINTAYYIGMILNI